MIRQLPQSAEGLLSARAREQSC
ncbi:MAG: hypothetical protein QOC79_147, partial [Actinomycetota bacterium]|nr:hypothetical protein [Actinomycetota bacterium]